MMEVRKVSDVFFHGDNEFFLLSQTVQARRDVSENMVITLEHGSIVILSDKTEIERFTKAYADMLDSCDTAGKQPYPSTTGEAMTGMHHYLTHDSTKP